MTNRVQKLSDLQTYQNSSAKLVSRELILVSASQICSRQPSFLRSTLQSLWTAEVGYHRSSGGYCASCYKLFELSEDVFFKWTDGQGVAGKNLDTFSPEIGLTSDCLAALPD